jgi:hypothetical protein
MHGCPGDFIFIWERFLSIHPDLEGFQTLDMRRKE